MTKNTPLGFTLHTADKYARELNTRYGKGRFQLRQDTESFNVLWGPTTYIVDTHTKFEYGSIAQITPLLNRDVTQGHGT